METYSDGWNACLLFRNKQLTKQLKNYQEASVLADCSSSLLLAMSQLLRLHQHPSYGIVRDDTELVDYCLGPQELKLCYLVRARLCNKAVAALFNITSQSVLKTKQRIKNKLSLSATDSLDLYIQQI